MRLYPSIGIVLLLSLLVVGGTAKADVGPNDAAKSLPDQITSFHAAAPAALSRELINGLTTEEFGQLTSASRSYRDDSGNSFVVEVINAQSDSAAYAILTHLRSGAEEIKTDVVGIASVVTPSRILFSKGNIVAKVSAATSASTLESLLQFARDVAAVIPAGDDDVPVLVRHLPNADAMLTHASYSVTLPGLKKIVPGQAILDSLDFEGGAEAVSAKYAETQLVIVEFNTPQFAGDNDRRIAARIEELKAQGQSLPSAYRRVGNYSVFVFNASNEAAANQLIDQVQYQKVVQWLGEDPHLYERMQRYFAQTSAGVLMAVLKSSGVSLIVCFGVGGLLGFLLFRHRRAQKAALYSDAGGSVRLNLDELTGPDSSHLLKPHITHPSDSTEV